MKKSYIAAAIIACTAFSINAFAKEVRCKVTVGHELEDKYYGVTGFQGKCIFIAEKDGSFDLSRKNGRSNSQTFYQVSVAITQKNVAEVWSANTRGGTALKWGTATRSITDRACWVGDDFEICAY